MKLQHIVNSTVKSCKCGKQWSLADILKNGKRRQIRLQGEITDGIWWDCDCKSMLVLRLKRGKEE